MQNSLENIISEMGKELNGKISIPIVVGGWAVNLLGFPRSTLDFDFMIFEDEFESVATALRKSNYNLAVKTPLYARFQSETNTEMPYIDCLFANKSTYDKLVSAGKMVNIFGVDFILPDVMHIIAMKLHAIKYGDGYRDGKDLIDTVSLIEIHNIDISKNSLFAELCDRYADAEIFKRIKDATKKK